MAYDENTVWALHIAPGGPPPLEKPLPWNLHCYYMNETLPGKEVHIDSREPLKEDWWKDYPDVERLEIHGDLPGGFDAVRHFTKLDELVICDSPSLKSLEFLQELKVLENLQPIRCPALADMESIVELKLKQDQLRGNY